MGSAKVPAVLGLGVALGAAFVFAATGSLSQGARAPAEGVASAADLAKLNAEVAKLKAEVERLSWARGAPPPSEPGERAKEAPSPEVPAGPSDGAAGATPAKPDAARAGVAGAATAKKPVGPADPAKLAQVAASADEAIRTKKTSRRLSALLREAAQLGPEAWPTVAKLELALARSNQSRGGGGMMMGGWGGGGFNYWGGGAAMPGTDLSAIHEDALANPDKYDPAYRQHAAAVMPWSTPPAADGSGADRYAELALRQLAVERDETVAQHLAQGLMGRIDEENLGDVLTALKAQKSAGARLSLTYAITQVDTPESTAALETLAQDQDPQVKQVADMAVKSRKNTVAGYFIDSVTPGSQAATAGLKPGDVITGYNAMVIASQEDVWKARSAVQPTERVTLAFVRDGQRLTAEIKGGQIGVNGHTVTPRER